MAWLTIKAIEKSFSSYFADANIKNRTKHDAMQNVANRLNMRSHKGKKVQFHITEGDGAKWDSCCNADVRDQIENVLLEHVIKYFAKDPNFWPTFSECLLANAKDQKLNLKSTKMSDVLGALKVEIEAIRQSGDRGTFHTNFVLWTCVLAADPCMFVRKLPTRMASVLGSCRSIPAPLAVVKPFCGSSLRATTLYWARLST